MFEGDLRPEPEEYEAREAVEDPACPRSAQDMTDACHDHRVSRKSAEADQAEGQSEQDERPDRRMVAAGELR